MSTAAVRLPSHTPSPAYVPRNISRPPSPAIQTSHTIPPYRSASSNRQNGATDRRGSSSLRNEIDIEREEGEIGSIDFEKGKGKERVISPSVQAVLNMIAALPAPLPSSLPPKFLNKARPQTSRPSGSFTITTTTRSLSTPTKRTFEQSHSSSSVGLGLGLSVFSTTDDNEARKKRKLSASPTKKKVISPDMSRSVSTPTLHARRSTPISPIIGLSPLIGHGREKLGFSGLRNEVGVSKDGLGGLQKDQWKEMAQTVMNRALLSKRRGDAHSQSPTAHAAFAHLPADRIKGLLCLTDAVLLWLWAYFCDEQADRVRSTPYTDSAPLRDFVKKLWEGEMRKAKDEVERDRAKGMVGLMHLIEAVVCYHLSAEQLSHLAKRSKELSTQSTSHHGPSPPSTTDASPPNGAPPTSKPQTNPSPTAHSSSSPSSSISSSLPPDFLPLVTSSTSSSSRASQHLLTSRHHLPLSLLRNRFPKTYECAINSTLGDEALPAPGDALGNARWLDVDNVEKFGWPIELGMYCPVGHLSVFGRGLVKGFAEASGRSWDVEAKA